MTSTVRALPAGFRVVLDRNTRLLDPGTLFGGAPARVLRLSETGQNALAELLGGPVRTRAAGVLARRLTDAGLAVAAPPRDASAVSVTVVIPARDRAPQLARCLRALGDRHAVIVVDDGSQDPSAVARVTAAHGARLVRRATNGGPAAARNTAIRLVETDAVAMLDSDCVAPPGWIEQLAAHLADPLVALVAPRIRPRFATSAVGRYGSHRSCLDLGPAAAAVAPRTRVAYVPTAAVIARRAALLDVAVDGAVFDEALRYGEDVDLVWRLHDAGWRSRYDPSVVVAHDEPERWRALVTRRFRYGTSAAPLALRHPAHTVALVLPPWPAIAVAGLLAGRPSLSAAGAAATLVAVGRTVRRAGLPANASLHSTARILGQTWTGTGRYVSQFGLFVAAAAVVAGGRRSSSWQARLRRGAWLGLLLAPIAADRRRCPPDLDPIRGAVAQLADEAAYGAGVWAGCLRHRSLRALRPAAFRSARRPRPRGVT